ncbi:MAG: hypothetical protein RLZZ360_94 [Candidatus Parcubacteria bacterium]|jgi:hypothetical protein
MSLAKTSHVFSPNGPVHVSQLPHTLFMLT